MMKFLNIFLFFFLVTSIITTVTYSKTELLDIYNLMDNRCLLEEYKSKFDIEEEKQIKLFVESKFNLEKPEVSDFFIKIMNTYVNIRRTVAHYDDPSPKIKQHPTSVLHCYIFFKPVQTFKWIMTNFEKFNSIGRTYIIENLKFYSQYKESYQLLRIFLDDKSEFNAEGKYCHTVKVKGMSHLLLKPHVVSNSYKLIYIV